MCQSLQQNFSVFGMENSCFTGQILFKMAVQMVQRAKNKGQHPLDLGHLFLFARMARYAYHMDRQHNLCAIGI